MSSLDAGTLFGVKGLVAVITGGGTGIGLMMTKALEENGAKVYIIGRRKESLENAAKQAKHGNIIPMQGDVTKKEDLNRIVDSITKSDGFINVLVANSGVSGPTVFDKMPPNPTLSQYRDVLYNMDTEEFTNTFRVNVGAAFFSVVAFLELLDAGNKKGNVEQRSQVIVTSSISGFIRLPLSGYAYAASKASATHMMKQFSSALVPYGIRSNVIAPGIYPSELANDFIKKHSENDGLKKFVPEERAGSIEDMAGSILFLTSKAGGYLNGNVLVTDGGRLAVVPSAY
ncbi:related to 3-oxoacyl-[acyl-carrier-protein] reductase [Phialocephala subalpina]|uniref:Related to 3-oxoacyl-[acyl-carrier-protein] reductase n=1 Tax=Phialocephala subalpina TaxID=576137 RepID=A0A1L7WZS8_9HELO|nr:related to 3-oxoacyl-[acyl-carrier-protein] reductase [Phialocephala subalpina]